MANSIGTISMSSSSSASVRFKNFKTKTMRENIRVRNCSITASTTIDPYRTLRIHPDASKSEVKKAFRKLALQYHPDVCKGNNTGIDFHHVNEAYDVVMSQFRGESTKAVMKTYESYDEVTEEVNIGMNDPDFDLWEEWMGWEGAGIHDYSSHINPYL